jgi:hypothetical protein
LVISLETVIGVPEQVTVKRRAKTERATWYIPIPSAPIVRERYMRYKNPKNFSHIENTVTIATVLKNFLNAQLSKSYLYILFGSVLKYNSGMKKFYYRVQEGQTLKSISEKTGISVNSIIKENALTEEVWAGDLLFLTKEDCTFYKVLPQDTVKSICKKFNLTEEQFFSLNGVPYVYYGQIIKV